MEEHNSDIKIPANKVNNDCAILILSCDKNMDVLKIFINAFYKNWPNCSLAVYLGMETEKPDFEKCIVLNSNADTWAARVKQYLLRIPQVCVLILLDDFIIESPVNIEAVTSYIELMKGKSEIANITMTHIPDSKNIKYSYAELLKRDKKGKYLLNMQSGIWKKNVLYELLKDIENPWETELYGSIRARKYADRIFLCLDTLTAKPINYNDGWLIVRGVWNGNEIERLGLSDNKNIVSGNRSIIYADFGKISFTKRAIRRLNIMLRQFLSKFYIYI